MYSRSQLHRRRSSLARAWDQHIPALVEFGNFITVALRNALLADPHPAAVQRYLELTPYDLDLFGDPRERRPTNDLPGTGYDQPSR